MNKLLSASVVALSFMVAGCNYTSLPQIPHTQYSNVIVGGIEYPRETEGGLTIWTDPSSGCNYYVYRISTYQAGFSVRYNSDGMPDCPDAKNK